MLFSQPTGDTSPASRSAHAIHHTQQVDVWPSIWIFQPPNQNPVLIFRMGAPHMRQTHACKVSHLFS
jgi:hypothetical protein